MKNGSRHLFTKKVKSKRAQNSHENLKKQIKENTTLPSKKRRKQEKEEIKKSSNLRKALEWKRNTRRNDQ